MTTSEFFMSAWDWKPSVVAGCAVLLGAYAWAVRFRFSQRAAAWLTGVLLIFLALVSPLDELADRYLFSVHMAKHILFVLVVPALLLIGLPAAPFRGVLRFRPAAIAEKFLATPAVAWTAGIGAMALWHIPVLFNAALSNEALHIFEHLSLLIAGTIFWWPILAPLPECRLTPVPQAAAYLFTACLACTSLGVLVTFAPRLLYPSYAQPNDVYAFLPVIRQTWGVSPAMDQQIGGLLMWVPGCLIYLTAIMAMFARSYAQDTKPPLKPPVEPQWT
jgi:cytochrome c oxidase assembly factor CtaG